ncbi:MAG: helix-turn-helix domain-containing protein [Bryobacterales bacterium]|nr:helix-turn-helix domain-containing protein [Bryobacterales bacterium]
MQRFDNTRPEFSPYGFTCELWVPARMPRPNRHNEIELNLLRSGSLTYLLGERRVTIAARRLAVFWAAIPHQIVDFVGEAPYFVVTVPLSGFLAAGLDSILVNRVLKGELMIDSAHDACDQLKFHQWEHELPESDPRSERAVWLEVQARLLRLARVVSNRRTASYPEPALSRADRLACYIARNYHQPLTSERVAAANGMHANYAMNLFRRAFDTTMGTFITQHRISHAQRLLVTTDDPVVSIAFRAGFQSLSRFNEAFKAACGCSPRQYRREHRGTHHDKRPTRRIVNGTA